jgi:hypothetical protein
MAYICQNESPIASLCAPDLFGRHFSPFRFASKRRSALPFLRVFNRKGYAKKKLAALTRESGQAEPPTKYR